MSSIKVIIMARDDDQNTAEVTWSDTPGDSARVVVNGVSTSTSPEGVAVLGRALGALTDVRRKAGR